MILTAAIPGMPPPRLVSKAMVDNMEPGSVIVDIAANKSWGLKYLLRGIYIYATPLRFKLGGRPVLSAHLNVETAGSERKRPEI
jgi:NAD(P) transhydrogenase subunit alpha